MKMRFVLRSHFPQLLESHLLDVALMEGVRKEAGGKKKEKDVSSAACAISPPSRTLSHAHIPHLQLKDAINISSHHTSNLRELHYLHDERVLLVSVLNPQRF